jgi:hypothetical protein
MEWFRGPLGAPFFGPKSSFFDLAHPLLYYLYKLLKCTEKLSNFDHLEVVEKGEYDEVFDIFERSTKS